MRAVPLGVAATRLEGPLARFRRHGDILQRVDTQNRDGLHPFESKPPIWRTLSETDLQLP